MNMLKISLILMFCTLMLLTPVAHAQSSDDTESKVDTILQDSSTDDQANQPNDEISDEKESSSSKTNGELTGTLADDDPDSSAFNEKKVFGDDEAGDDESDSAVAGATHLLRMEFASQVVILDKKIDTAIIEIHYITKIEQEIEVKDKRFRTRGRADVATDIVGNLAGNELFTCKLDIQLEKTPVDIMTRYNNTTETEDEPAKSELAVQIKFKKSDFFEDWFSNCIGVDGSVFNTKGDKEKYLSTTLESISPSLDAMLFEDYNPDDTVSLDISTDPIILDDLDAFEEVTLQGSGSVAIEPMQ